MRSLYKFCKMILKSTEGWAAFGQNDDAGRAALESISKLDD